MGMKVTITLSGKAAKHLGLDDGAEIDAHLDAYSADTKAKENAKGEVTRASRPGISTSAQFAGGHPVVKVDGKALTVRLWVGEAGTASKPAAKL